jgi:hypothetical protein
MRMQAVAGTRTSTAITLSRMRRSVAAKALPCSVCAQLPTRVMGVRCMPRRTVPKSLLPCSASTDEDVLLVGGGRSSPFLSEREHGLTPATSAPGPALPLASLQRDRALGDAGGIIRVGSGSPDGQGPSHASTIGRGEAHALRTAELAAAPSPSRPVVPAAVAEADTDADAEVSRERLTRALSVVWSRHSCGGVLS